jgi:hypothetical protein
LAGAAACNWRKRSLQLFRDIIILMRDTGMQNERELYRMRIENLDWETRVIFVPDSKTEEGRRRVPMSNRVFDSGYFAHLSPFGLLFSRPMAFQPMPLSRRPLPFDHPEWVFELKYDGFRSLAVIQNGRTTSQTQLIKFPRVRFGSSWWSTPTAHLRTINPFSSTIRMRGHKTTVKFRLGLVTEDVHAEKDSFRNSARRRCLCHFLRSTG